MSPAKAVINFMACFAFMVGAIRVSTEHPLGILIALLLAAVTFYEGLTSAFSCVTFTFSGRFPVEEPEDTNDDSTD